MKHKLTIHTFAYDCDTECPNGTGCEVFTTKAALHQRMAQVIHSDIPDRAYESYGNPAAARKIDGLIDAGEIEEAWSEWLDCDNGFRDPMNTYQIDEHEIEVELPPSVPSEHSDPAAILGAAMSVHNTFEEYTQANHLNLSEIYGGGDEFMRQCLRVAILFEGWACEHVDFARLNDVWPYLMQDKFGLACLTIVLQQLSTHGLTAFDTTDCLKVAHELQLIIK